MIDFLQTTLYNQNTMKKMKPKQILALAGIILLVAMYVCTLIFAIINSPQTQVLFRASLACTVIIPVILYVFLMAARMVRPSKSPVIDSVVFDVGRVLLDFPWEKYAETLNVSEDALKFLNDKVVYSPLWGQFDLNNRPYEEIVREFCDLGPEYREETRKFVDTIDRCISPYPYTDGWLSGLKRHGYRLYLLSNWSERTYDRLKESGIMDFTKYMDGCVWSFEHHVAKPHKEIFDILVKKYGVDPSRTVFIDDNLSNIKAAQSYGYQAILFSDFQDARTKLKDLGVRD